MVQSIFLSSRLLKTGTDGSRTFGSMGDCTGLANTQSYAEKLHGRTGRVFKNKKFIEFFCWGIFVLW